jgi:G3E family GTPase
MCAASTGPMDKSQDGTAPGKIVECTYFALRPFDPLRFYCLVNMPWPEEVSAAGCFWIATRPDWRGELTCHDGAVQYRDCGVWWATLWRSPPGNWPALRPEGESDWHPVLGDRCQRIVVSGPALGAAGILLAFDKCLVEGNDEITTWNPAWDSLPDPFARSQLIDPARFKSKRSGAAH